MSAKNENDKKNRLNKRDHRSGEDDGGESGGGKSGQIEFKDFLANAERFRDDQLPAEEKRRLLSVHKDTHELRVKKQKELREQRQLMKEGKIPLQTYKQGIGSGMSSQYKAHPTLSNKAQFSGIDSQVNTLPTENIAETNNEKRNELELQYQLRHQPKNAPRFNPKPQYR